MKVYYGDKNSKFAVCTIEGDPDSEIGAIVGGMFWPNPERSFTGDTLVAVANLTKEVENKE